MTNAICPIIDAGDGRVWCHIALVLVLMATPVIMLIRTFTMSTFMGLDNLHG